jgi:hypothetical protein
VSYSPTYDGTREQRSDESRVQAQHHLLAPLGHQQRAIREVVVVHRHGVEDQVRRVGLALFTTSFCCSEYTVQLMTASVDVPNLTPPGVSAAYQRRGGALHVIGGAGHHEVVGAALQCELFLPGGARNDGDDATPRLGHLDAHLAQPSQAHDAHPRVRLDFSPALFRSRQNTVQLMTAGTVHPCNQSENPGVTILVRRMVKTTVQLMTAGTVHVNQSHVVQSSDTRE